MVQPSEKRPPASADQGVAEEILTAQLLESRPVLDNSF